MKQDFNKAMKRVLFSFEAERTGVEYLFPEKVLLHECQRQLLRMGISVSLETICLWLFENGYLSGAVVSLGCIAETELLPAFLGD